MNNINIIGTGYAIPEHCISNDDLAEVVDTSDEWIKSRTGISTRYLSDNENTSDLGYRAAEMAIKKSGIDRKRIDLIVVATMTPDNVMPSTACIIQAKLGLNGCHVMAFDINAACSGFIYALQIAANMLNNYHYALVIGSETLSKIVDWTDRNTCVLFGDGAGALLLENTLTDCVMNFYAQSIGDDNGVLKADGVGLTKPLMNSDAKISYITMNGREVFRFAVNAIISGIDEVLNKRNLTIDDVDLIIPHQANIRIIDHVARKYKIDKKKFFVNLDRYGNTSAASVAIALAQCFEEKRIKKGMKIVLVGFGGGLTYGSALIEL